MNSAGRIDGASAGARIGICASGWRRTLICGIATLALMGCGTYGGGSGSAQTPPANLLALCPTPLPAPDSGKVPHLLMTMKEWTELYYDCADRHASLVRALDPPDTPRWWQFWRIYW